MGGAAGSGQRAAIEDGDAQLGMGESEGQERRARKRGSEDVRGGGAKGNREAQKQAATSRGPKVKQGGSSLQLRHCQLDEWVSAR